jgi:hypothetical protein
VAELGRVDAEHPWPWLEPFTETAKGFFNGRTDDIAALERSVLARPVCVLFGKSGLGKTSLLLAGLFPRLRDQALLPVPLRRLEHGTAAAPLATQLLRALHDAAQQAGLHWSGSAASPAPDDDVATLWELLHDRARPLVDAAGGRWSVVFVLDQFEEIFTLQADEQARLHTFQQLGDLLENRVPPAVVARMDAHEELLDRIDFDNQRYRCVVALREDFLPELENWTELIPRLAANRCRLLPMSAPQALDAVQMTGGALVDADAAARIVDFLARQAAQGAAGRAVRESRRIEPALLSLICASLNAERLAREPPGAMLDVANLETRGARILDRFYDDAFAALDEAQRGPAARWLEANLITEGGTRRPYPMAAVDSALAPALRRLVDRRLLRIESGENGDQIELVHDRLAAVALRRAQASQQQAEVAQRLRTERDAAALEVLEQKARAAELAREREALERKSADDRLALARLRESQAVAASQRIRRSVLALVVVLVLLLGLSLWAVSERQRAVAAQRDAVAAQRTAEQARRDAEEALAAQRQSSEQAQRQYAEKRVLEQTRDTAAAKVQEASRLLESNQPDKRSQANVLLTEANRAYKSTPPAPAPAAACPDGRRIYPQVGDAADRDDVDRVAPALREAGFIVPRTEVVVRSKMPSSTEVRYFRRNEEEGAIWATVALSKAGLRGVPARYVAGSENSAAIRPCHYELWLVPGKR